MTRIFRIDKNNFMEAIRKAALIIKEGGTVAFPTETVYGLGADALDPDAVARIFKAKGRPADNPLIVHIASQEQIPDIAKSIPEHARKMMEMFWPGPLTLILRRKEIVPDITTGGLDTVAVRMPSNPIAIELIRQAGTPIAAPSANVSGRPSPTTAEHVISDLKGRIDAVIDGGHVEIGVESTVVDVTRDIPVILRPGEISAKQLSKCTGEVMIGYEDRTLGEDEIARSPGMKYTHYSPQTKVILVEGKIIEEVEKKITDLVEEHHIRGMRAGLLISKESAEKISADETFLLGERDRPSQAAQKLFKGLRELDSRGVDVIIVDGLIKREGVGAAVLNRIRKAADEQINV